MSQRPVDGERIGRHVRVEPLREHRLVDIARGDILLERPHAVLERVARHVGRDVSRGLPRRGWLRQGAFQLALEKLDLRARELIQRLQIFIRCDARVRDDEDPMLDVVEGQHRIEQHEPRFVFTRFRGRGGACAGPR